ncbi:MAG TPA: hypothetical protein DF383_04510 [Deltaproteobacteria bacterium]|nr:hypothetical protein [Deltaproteobacteria bacterium]
MSRRLLLALVLSLAGHLILVLLFVFFGIHGGGSFQTLSEAGGVVWFNLNPGGAGLGGQGGLGAPVPVDPQAALPSIDSKIQQPPVDKKIETETGVLPSRKQPKKKLKAKTSPVSHDLFEEKLAEPSSSQKEKTTQAGWPGPGQGDEPGDKTGPGGGPGEGLGEGEGGGRGSGKGPGGIGVPGTGGSGTGGESSTILAEIRKRIMRAKRYPIQARNEGLEGICGISFEIGPSGGVTYVTLTKSSGYAVLDNEALATVRRAAPFPYYAGPIRFSLRFDLQDL